MNGDLWLDGDPFDDPAWQQAALMADAPPKPVAKNHGVYSLAYLARAAQVARTPSQLVVALLLYRKALMLGCPTVALSNCELREFGVSRYAKYRALAFLQGAGALTIEAYNGRAIRVTLHWFP